MNGMTKQPVVVVVAVAVTAAVLLVALWVAGAGEVWFIQEPQPTNSAEDDSAQGEDPTEGGDQREVVDDRIDQGDVGVWFDIVATIFLCLVALALLTSFVRRTQRRRRRRRHAQSDEGSSRAGPSALADAAVVPPGLVEATDDLTAVLMQGTPRNAIVSCWVALEQACADAGLARHQSETSVEFTTRVLSTFTVDEESIVELAGLYREARFSSHLLTEQHRERAVGCLQDLQSRLRSAVRRDAGVQP